MTTNQLNILRLILAALGFATGIVTGISGSSGFIVVVPALVEFGHFPITVAVGSSLAVDTLTSTVVVWSYARQGNIRLGGAWKLAVGAIAGAQVGSRVAQLVPAVMVGRLFVLITAGFATNFLWHGYKNQPLVDLHRKPPDLPFPALATITAGLVVGCLTGLIGASGGVMFLLVLVYLFRYDLRPAIGTATAIMALSALSGSVGYLITNQYSWQAIAIVGGLSIPTGYGVARLAQSIPPRWHLLFAGAIILSTSLSMIQRVV